MASAIGLIKVATPDEILAEEAKADTESAEKDTEFDPRAFMDGLARYVRDCFDEAYRFKLKDERRFHEAMYARRGEYTPEKLRQIRQAGASEEYARIVANKSRILESWLKDIFLSQSERPWTISPTPEPSLAEDDMMRVRQQVNEMLGTLLAQGVAIDPARAQELLDEELSAATQRKRDLAERRAERMEKKIADQLAEGGFAQAFSDFITYLTTFPGAIFKGPIFRNRERIVWDSVEGTHIPRIERKIVMEFEAPNPLNCYPAPGATTPQEGYFIEHITLTSKDLYDLIGLEGYSEAAIRTVLDRANATGGLRWIDSARGAGIGGDEKNSSYTRTHDETASYIDVLEFHGPVRGADLIEWGLDDVDLDPQGFYEATVWLIDDQVIKAILNDDPMGRRPYYKACYEEIPGQFWGYSLYDVLADVQGVANAAIRSLVNNMAIASGPQVVVNIDRLPPDTDITNLYPWKIWQVVDSQFSNKADPAINFYQPNTNVQDLVMVLERFYTLADDFSMIPRYMSGSDKISGPARTASGLSMLLDAANKGLKGIVQDIDQNVMTPLLNQIFDHNMIYDDDDSIKGDAQVTARGVASLMQLETLRLRRNEFLQITANPIDSQIVGIEGRAAILREIAKGLGMDVNKIVPPVVGQPMMQGPQRPQPPQGPNASQEQLANGTPTTDVASPSSMV